MRVTIAFFASLAAFAASFMLAQAPVAHGVAVANMDTSVKPGDDFYQYANGGWIARTEIPPDRGRISVFNTLRDQSDKRTADLIEAAAKVGEAAKDGGAISSNSGSNTRKIAAVYKSYMDEAGLEAKGLAPLRPHLKSIAAIRNQRELSRALGETLRADVDALNNTNFHTANLFGLWVAPGFVDSEHYTAYLLQGGLEMPDREYYIADSQRMRDIRAKYQTHVAALLKLAGFTDTGTRAKAFWIWRPLLRKNTPAWRTTKTCIRPTTRGRQRILRLKPRGSIGRSTSGRRGSPNRRASSYGSRRRSRRSRRWSGPQRSRRGRTGWRST